VSYIRCLSNPEGLYMWHDVSGKVAMCCSAILDKHGNPKVLYFPAKDFFKAVRLWEDNYGEPVKVGDIELREVWVNVKTGRIREDPKNRKEAMKSVRRMFRKSAAKYDLKILFRYKRERIFMWQVTWEYAVNQVLCQKFRDRDVYRRYEEFFRMREQLKKLRKKLRERKEKG
jgi:hypothetical protein